MLYIPRKAKTAPCIMLISAVAKWKKTTYIVKELCSSSIPLLEIIEQAKDDLLSQSEDDRATGIEFVS